MSKSKEVNQRDLSYSGCYGSVVSYAEVGEFLQTSFHMNRLAEEHGDSRYAACIWGHPGIGKCVSGDTLVKTQHGVVEIASLFDGIEKEGFYPVSDLFLATRKGAEPVKSLYFSGRKKAIRIKTDFGRELVGSEIHPVLCASDNFRWKTLSEICIGDFVVVRGFPLDSQNCSLPAFPSPRPRQKSDFSIPKKMNPDLAFILGCLVGEGSVSGDIIAFTQAKDKLLASAFVKKFKSLFGVGVSEEHDRRTENTYNFRCFRSLLRHWLELIGLGRVCSSNKEIPWSVLCSSATSQKSFLKALYEGEGTNEVCGISLSSASKRLLEQVSTILLGFGIQASLSFRVVDGTTYWNLLCSGENGRLLNELIGFSRASGKWTKVVGSNPNKGGVPAKIACEMLLSMKDSHLNNGGKLSKKMIHSSPLNKIYNQKHLPQILSVTLVEKIMKIFNKASNETRSVVEDLLRSKYERVVSVEVVDDLPLYDVTMDTEEHEFLSNGFVSHNTAIVKQLAKCPVEWNGKMYPGYHVSDVPVAQFEEMGDLHGIPMDCVLMRQPSKKDAGEFITQWVAQKDQIIHTYLANGWEIDTSVQPTTRYAPPDWVPTTPGPSIVLFDDWNRPSLRVIKGMMQLLQNFGMVSWKLPLGCNIVLTGNPDEQDYLVTSIDTAIVTRIRHITLKEDMAEWAVWAEASGLDARGISYALRYPEMITGIGRERTNPRTFSEFCRFMRHIGTEDKERLIRHGMSLLDEQTVSNIIVFFERELELVIEPDEILAGDDSAFKAIENLMSRKEPRVDILGVICERLFARIVQPGFTIEKPKVANFHRFLEMDCVPEDVRYGLCHRITKRGSPELNRWLVGSKKLQKIIASTLRLPA